MCDDRDDDFQIEAGECEACAVGQYLSDAQDQCVCKYNSAYKFISEKNWRASVMFVGTTDTPVLDFWWRLPWVSKPEGVFTLTETETDTATDEKWLA